jgi:hypothetical protein
VILVNPTVQQSDVETQLTLSMVVSAAWLVSTLEGFIMDQVVPSQCMAKACRALSRVSLDWPTAQQSDAEMQVTSLK